MSPSEPSPPRAGSLTGRPARGLAAALVVVAFLMYLLLRGGERFEGNVCSLWRTSSSIGPHGPPETWSGGGDPIERGLTSPDMTWLWRARIWLAIHPKRAPELVSYLADPVFVGLNGPNVAVRGRAPPSRGHGFATDEDLYTRAGRASWLLREATGRDDAPSVPIDADSAARAAAMNWWRAWFAAVDGGKTCFDPR